MSDPVKLVSKRASIDDEIQAGLIELLEELLANARDGRFSWMIILAAHRDGKWEDLRSGVAEFPRAIGMLEVTKARWIEAYRKERDKEL